MSWFDAAGFANLAKNAFKEAQKTIDKALTENDDSNQDSETLYEGGSPVASVSTSSSSLVSTPCSKSNSTIWESLTNSLFEKPKSPPQNVSTKNEELGPICTSYVENVENPDGVKLNWNSISAHDGANFVYPLSVSGSKFESVDMVKIDAMKTENLPQLEDIFKMQTVENAIMSDMISPWECSGIQSVIEMDDSPRLKPQPDDFGGKKIDSELPEYESPLTTGVLSRSSYDEGTIVGNNSDEGPKEGTVVTTFKTMLADALDESVETSQNFINAHEENIPECGKQCSSEHTSADELETATSSDVEVISSANGDGSSANSRQSPARLIYKHPTGKMSVVVSSDILIPQIIGKSLSFKMAGHHNREHSEASSGSSDDNNITEVERLYKELMKLNDILEARDKKLLECGKRNAELAEINASLKSQMEMQMSEEFTRRMSALEKKFQQAIMEKESLRIQLSQMTEVKEKTKVEAKSEDEEYIENKDQIIKELREEGEKLSKQQLTASVLIKKLRATEKDNFRLISSLKQQNENVLQELERCKKSLKEKDELERVQIEAVDNLTRSNQLLDKKASTLQIQMDNLTTTLISTQRELQEKEITLENVSEQLKESKALARMEAVQELEARLEVEEKEKRLLKASLNDVQKSMQRLQTEMNARESKLRQDMSKLVATLENYKRQNESMCQQLSDCTKPYAKQIESEINKFNAASNSWQQQEASYAVVIRDLQSDLHAVRTMLESDEQQVIHLKRQIEHLNSDIRDYVEKIEALEKCLRLNKDRNEEILKEHNDCIAKKHDELMEMKGIVYQLLQPTVTNDPECLCETPLHGSKKMFGVNSGSQSPVSSLERVSAHDSACSWPTIDEDLGASSSQMGSTYGGSSFRAIATTTSVLENLQSQLKRRDGEVQQLQWELRKRDHERSLLTDELANLTRKLESLEKATISMGELQKQYDALLQMYGEKVEEAQELKLDLEDVKAVSRMQIEQLLAEMKKNG